MSPQFIRNKYVAAAAGLAFGAATIGGAVLDGATGGSVASARTRARSVAGGPVVAAATPSGAAASVAAPPGGPATAAVAASTATTGGGSRGHAGVEGDGHGEATAASPSMPDAPSPSSPQSGSTAGPTYVTHAAGGYVETGGPCGPADRPAVPAVPPSTPLQPIHMWCTGTAVADGTWTGTWVEQVEGYLDPNTGSSVGTADETLTGLDPGDGTHGSLHVIEHFTVDGSTSTLTCTGTIVGGTGDWDGSSGTYACEGINVLPGHGGWRATWVRPGHPAAHGVA